MRNRSKAAAAGDNLMCRREMCRYANVLVFVDEMID
jgi:hypothetical protein